MTALRVTVSAWIIAVLGLVAFADGSALAQSAPQITLDLTRLVGNEAEARRIAVTVIRGVRSGRDLPTQHLRNARARMVKGRSIPIADLRALADAGDGVAALRLIRRIEDGDYQVTPGDLAHYYGIAAATGRVVGLTGVVRLLARIDREDIDPKRLRILKDIVMAYAMAGNSVAVRAMMGFHIAERPFGPIPDDMLRLAERARGIGRDVIALQLASDLIQSDWDDAAALTRARGYLHDAAQSRSVRVTLIAANLLPVLNARLQTLALATSEPEANR